MARVKKETKAAVKAKKTRTKAAAKSSSKAKVEKPVRQKRVKKEVEQPVEQNVDMNAFLRNYMVKAADRVEKEENLSSSLNDSYRLQVSNLLVFSILLDGGLNSCWMSVSGEEGSSKSACALTCVKAAYEAGVPLIYYHDAENAVKKKFAASVFNVKDVKDVFGHRDEKGNYTSIPLVRYSWDNRLETVFKVIRKNLLRLPDKQFNESTGKWYYVFDRTKEAKKQIAEMGLKDHDKKLYSITGSYWFEAQDDTLQYFGVIDSLPALVPTVAQDDEESENKKIAYLAGPLSRHIPMVKGLLKRKHAAILVVNQLRDKIAITRSFGPNKSEPGGNAAKFFSEFRLQFTPVWPPEHFTKNKKMSEQCIEPSVEGSGNDLYMFKRMKVTKTKTSAVGAVTYARMWVKDCNGNPRGYDPVFDTYQSLSDLGLLEGKHHRTFKVLLPKLDQYEFDWETFKYCILIETNKSKQLWKKFLAGPGKKLQLTKPLKIRAALQALIAKGNLDKYTVKAAPVDTDEPIDIDDDE